VSYTDLARPFLRAWKEGGLRPLAPIAAELVTERVPRPAVEAITFIPADGDRSVRRGHQPAQALARELGRLWGIDVAPLIRRSKAVGRQTGLDLAERRRNMRGAFVAAGAVPATVAVVDDVYTTGATAGAAAAALRAAGAKSIDVLSFARAVR